MNQLTTDAGLSTAHLVTLSPNKIAKNEIAIRQIQADDLFYLEKDLAFNEKVRDIFVFS